MADGGHFEKMSAQKACGYDILWNVDWIAFKFDVVICWVLVMFCLTFGEESIKNKMADGRHFEKIATRRACGRNILWTIGWIAFKFYAVVLSPCPFSSDRQSNLDYRCALQLYEREGVRATWIFVGSWHRSINVAFIPRFLDAGGRGWPPRFHTVVTCAHRAVCAALVLFQHFKRNTQRLRTCRSSLSLSP